MARECKVLLGFILALISISALTHAQQAQRSTDFSRWNRNDHRLKSGPLPSPTPPASDFEVLETNTNLVQIDAVVTDKQGRHVADLTASDFEIVEGARTIAPIAKWLLT